MSPRMHGINIQKVDGFMRVQTLKGSPLCLLVAVVTLGCGSKAQFYGGSQEPAPLQPLAPESGSLDQVPSPPPAVPELPAIAPPPLEPELASRPGIQNVEWYWTCDLDKDQKGPESTGDQQVILKDQGEHALAYDPSVPTTFKFTGRVCPPSQLDRDIVFVVDVSTSMEGNDPRVIDSCARLAGVQSILQSLTSRPGQNPEAIRFGVVTFSSSLMTYSTGLYTSPQKFFDDLSKAGKPADILCEAAGGTNYESGIVKAAELLKGGRVGATKEVYLISDGQPGVGQDGLVLATQLKTSGVVTANASTPIKVTFATLMLKGIDTVMESKLASKDANGKALHAFVQNAQDLGSALGGLADSKIAKAELRVTQIAPSGESQVKVLDILPYLKLYDFSLPAFRVDWAGGGSKLMVDVMYSDTHGRLQEKHGSLRQK